jgi:adenylate kinase
MDPTVVLFGPPGSGKGTQAARLRDGLGYATLATGDLLREAREAGTELGRRAASYMDRGDLVPDDVVVGVLRESLGSHRGAPVVLDGFPRTVAQAEALDRALADRDREMAAAILLEVPDEEVESRIRSRGQGRSDDDPETVRERLRVYHRETEPLASYYSSKGLLRRVDGSGDPDDVASRIRAALP